MDGMGYDGCIWFITIYSHETTRETDAFSHGVLLCEYKRDCMDSDELEIGSAPFAPTTITMMMMIIIYMSTY